MARSYKEGREIEVFTKKHRILSRWHPELQNIPILYVFVDEMKSRGRAVMAKIKKATAFENWLTDKEIILMVNLSIWQRLDEASKVALIDHEFMHIDVDEKGRISLRHHDLEEFNAIVKRHGLWTGDVKAFAEQCNLKLGTEQPDQDQGRVRLTLDREDARGISKGADALRAAAARSGAGEADE